MLFIRFFVWVGIISAIGALLAGYLGALHPALDSFSHFRLHILIGGLVAVLAMAILGRRRSAAGVAALFAMSAATTIWPLMSTTSSAETTGVLPYKFLQMNVRFDNPDPKSALRVIAAAQPDVVSLQEVTPRWRAELETIKSAYPHSIYCNAHGKVGDVMILSRRPFVEYPTNSCGAASGLVLQAIDFNGRTILAGSMHLHWPWPFWQHGHVEELKGALEKADASGLPLLIGGDMNAASWSYTMRRLEQFSGAKTMPYPGSSWLPFEFPSRWTNWAGLPLDNILMDGLSVSAIEKQQNSGSDHLPLMIKFSVPASANVESESVIEG